MLRLEPLLGVLTISMHFCLKDVMPLLIACWPESSPDWSDGCSYSCVLATHRNVYQKTENGSHQFIIQCYAMRDFLRLYHVGLCCAIFIVSQCHFDGY